MRLVYVLVAVALVVSGQRTAAAAEDTYYARSAGDTRPPTG